MCFLGGRGDSLQGKGTSVSPSRDPLDKDNVEQADVLLLGINTLAKVKLNRIIAFLIRSHMTPASLFIKTTNAYLQAFIPET